MALDPVSALLDVGGKLIDRIWPDPVQAAAAKLELAKMQQNGELAEMTAQTNINLEEAKNSSLFVSGWRPFIGWVCGAGCAWNWVGLPVATFIAQTFLSTHIDVKPADLSEMFPLLLGMLGIGTLRTVEKIRKVA